MLRTTKNIEEKMQNNNTEVQKDYVGSSFVEFLTVTMKYRWFLFWFVFVITVCTTFYAVVIADKWYKATTSVFPANKTDLLGGLGGLSSLVNGFSSSKGLSALTGNPELDKYMAILKSSRLTDNVIKKYNYRKLYDFDKDAYYEKVKEAFESNVEIEIQDEGNLTLTFYDTEPKRAAEVANYMISLLNKISIEMNVKDAKFNREFIEKRYDQNLADINRLETEMQQFQGKYGIISVPAQLEQTVKTMAKIYSQLAQKEIEYNIIKNKYGMEYPLTKITKIEVDAISQKIKKLNAGQDDSQKDVKLLLPFKEAPALGNKYLKIYRNLEIQYKILEFITPVYEQAKVEEVRNTPSVSVLDRATVPERKAKPKGSLYALLSFVISAIIGFVFVFILEGIDRFKNSNRERYDVLVGLLKSDIRKITFSRKN